MGIATTFLLFPKDKHLLTLNLEIFEKVVKFSKQSKQVDWFLRKKNPFTASSKKLNLSN